MVEFGGKTVYFAGDTSVFGDMALLPRLETIDVALLPIGDNFTMGPKDARLAAELLNVPLVIPIHYNTWPLIAQDPAAFKKEVETTTQSKVLVVEPGKTVEL